METEDFRDCFICGTCKKQFSLLTEFLKHKGKCGRGSKCDDPLNLSKGKDVKDPVCKRPKNENGLLKVAQIDKPVIHDVVASPNPSRSVALQTPFSHPSSNARPLKPTTKPKKPKSSRRNCLRPILPKGSCSMVETIVQDTKTASCHLIGIRSNSSDPHDRIINVGRNLINFSSHSIDDCGDVSPLLLEINGSVPEVFDCASSASDSHSQGSKSIESNKVKNSSRAVCGYCGLKFLRLGHLENHLRVHTGEKPYQCIICGRCFPYKSSLLKHPESHKEWPATIRTCLLNNPSRNSSDITFSCLVCGEVFTKYRDYRSHLSIHKEEKVFLCQNLDCGLEFKSLRDLKDHLDVHPIKEYDCSFCRGSFATLEEIARHQQTKKEGCCNNASESVTLMQDFKNDKNNQKKQALERHLATTTHDYSCSVCGAKFLKEKLRREHLKKVHDTEDDSKRCPICFKIFKTKHNLGLHTRRHTGERHFRCSACLISFSRRDVFLKHMRRHEPMKPFPCPFRRCGCSAEFSTPETLGVHLRWHGAEEPYSCPICKKEYIGRAKISDHLCKIHPSFDGEGFVKTCLACQKEYNNLLLFLNHTCRERLTFKQKAEKEELRHESSFSEDIVQVEYAKSQFDSESEESSHNEDTVEILISIDKDDLMDETQIT
ncbi:zinc finger protein ZFP2-like isoform X2 [Artemia franciscana]|uniref:zinc finger protein ZFP2-like isoform X2 n=1 Tax=Artemia franciscana TaxID=6661 RepID=UPI0032D9CEFF